MKYYYVMMSSAFVWGFVLTIFLLIVMAISVGFVYGQAGRTFGQPLTAQQCRAAGGAVRSSAAGVNRCAPGEVDLGNVSGPASPAVCCRP